MPYTLFLLALAGLVGFSGGMVGIGGIFIPPVMVEFFDASPHVIMGSTQTSFILPCSMAVYMLWRRGQFDGEVVLLLSLPGCVCTFLAARFLKPHLDGLMLSLLLSAAIIAAGFFLLQPVKQGKTALSRPARRAALLGLGFLGGFVAGVTGAGSNALMLPILALCGLPLLVNVAACQAYSTLTALFGTWGNLMHGAVDLGDAFWLSIGQMAGIWLGVRVAQRTSTAALTRIMAGVCIASGGFMCVKSAALLMARG